MYDFLANQHEVTWSANYMQKVNIRCIRCGLQLSLMPPYVSMEMMKADYLFTNQALQETRDTGRQGQHKYQ